MEHINTISLGYYYTLIHGRSLLKVTDSVISIQSGDMLCKNNGLFLYDKNGEYISKIPTVDKIFYTINYIFIRISRMYLIIDQCGNIIKRHFIDDFFYEIGEYYDRTNDKLHIIIDNNRYVNILIFDCGDLSLTKYVIDDLIKIENTNYILDDWLFENNYELKYKSNVVYKYGSMIDFLNLKYIKCDDRIIKDLDNIFWSSHSNFSSFNKRSDYIDDHHIDKIYNKQTKTLKTIETSKYIYINDDKYFSPPWRHGHIYGTYIFRIYENHNKKSDNEMHEYIITRTNIHDINDIMFVYKCIVYTSISKTDTLDIDYGIIVYKCIEYNILFYETNNELYILHSGKIFLYDGEKGKFDLVYDFGCNIGNPEKIIAYKSYLYVHYKYNEKFYLTILKSKNNVSHNIDNNFHISNPSLFEKNIDNYFKHCDIYTLYWRTYNSIDIITNRSILKYLIIYFRLYHLSYDIIYMIFLMIQ